MTIEDVFLVGLLAGLLAGILSGVPVMLVLIGVPLLTSLVGAAVGAFDLALLSMPGDELGTLALVMGVVFVLGFVLEFVEIIFIVVPIVGPVLLAGSLDPVWLAVLFALNLQTSFLTPRSGSRCSTSGRSRPPRLKTMSGGRPTFKVFSSGELVPPFAVEDAVQQGTAEIGHSTPYYAAGKDPALHFFSTVPFGMSATEHTAWLRYGGGQELWDEIYAERGLRAFYSGNFGTQSAGWFREPIESLADLKGLNMRIAGLGGEAMRELGVNAVLLPPPEIFPAFKSGAIDAAEWVGPLLDQAFGLHKVANLCYVPAFHEPAAALEIVVNREAFDELPSDLQAIVANAAEATSVETLAQFDWYNTQAFGQLRDEGVEFREFSEEVIAGLRGAVTRVMDGLAADSESFRTVRESYDAFLGPAIEYANLMQGAMYRQRTG